MSPIVVRELLEVKVSVVKLEQPLKASAPIVVTVVGIVTLVRLLLKNAPSPILVIPSWSVMLVSPFTLFCLKALFPIVVTDDGMSILVRAVQFLKVSSGMLRRVLPSAKVTVARAVQSIKTLFPNVVTELGIVIDVRLVQFLKAFCLISVHAEGVANVTV